MNGQLLMSDLMTFAASSSVIGSLASGAGHMRSDSPAGQKISQCGQRRARASRSARPVKDWEEKTRATYGRCFDVWLAGANLQQSLGNKLRQRLAVYGSPEYELTWRDWDMQSGAAICALRASGRHILDNESSGALPPPRGWVTPSSRDWKDTPGMSTQGANPDGTTRKRIDQLPRQAAQALRVEDADEQRRTRESLGQLGTGHQGHWSQFETIVCLDDCTRRVEPGTFPLAHGIPERVGRLRGYGNAIVPPLAKEFIEAVMECL